ncbi:hypothetical protein DL98DRAFT_121594 [Cadophora sp. DSE1049]|nr:hypothetical protein DL98DRAFT_121594 [Cadophora sp. DSE1049]
MASYNPLSYRRSVFLVLLQLCFWNGARDGLVRSATMAYCIARRDGWLSLMYFEEKDLEKGVESFHVGLVRQQGNDGIL